MYNLFHCSCGEMDITAVFGTVVGGSSPSRSTNMVKKKLVCINYFCKHPNFNIILSIIAVVWVWRGIWGLTDAVAFSAVALDLEHIVGYGLPILIGVAYLYLNDYSISELEHGDPIG